MEELRIGAKIEAQAAKRMNKLDTLAHRTTTKQGESYSPTSSEIRRLGSRLSGKLTEIGEDLFDWGAADGSDSREGKATERQTLSY